MDEAEVDLIDAYWRAANYLSVGQIYLLDNPLLREPLTAEHIKPRLLGHWGTTPGLNLRLRAPQPGHPSSATSTCSSSPDRATAGRRWWPTSTSRAPTASVYPDVTPGRRGHAAGSSGSSPSRAASRATSRRETPGSIHEGGELGYSLSHAFGAAFDNPDLVVACVVGDGEAETGAAGHGVALQQVPEPGRRRGGAADPAPQRLQDRQPHRAGPHPRRRARVACSSATAGPLGSSTGDDPADRPPGHGGHPRRGARRDRRRSRPGPGRTAWSIGPAGR